MKQFLILFAVCGVVATFAACGGSDTAPSSQTATPETGLSSITSLQVTDTIVGTGVTAAAGRVITVNYTGWLYSASASGNKGTQFDSGRFDFTLGAGRVISGWDQGLLGMKVGGQRTLIIPPSLGYGNTGSPPVIRPNATLVFDVQLIAVN